MVKIVAHAVYDPSGDAITYVLVKDGLGQVAAYRAHGLYLPADAYACGFKLSEREARQRFHFTETYRR